MKKVVVCWCCKIIQLYILDHLSFLISLKYGVGISLSLVYYEFDIFDKCHSFSEVLPHQLLSCFMLFITCIFSPG